MATVTESGLYRLMSWLSPNFPVGAFAYSHGLEYAVEIEAIKDAETLTNWVGGVLTFGSGRVDAALFRSSWQAIIDGDDEQLRGVVERADALRGTSEMARESSAQGRAFLDTLLRVWPEPRLARWYDDLAHDVREPAYAVAVGVASALAGVAVDVGLTAYLHAFSGNLISAGVRLVPLGQTDGQRTVATLEPVVIACVQAALARDLDDVGSAAINVDWTSMKHETQYTRLFRS